MRLTDELVQAVKLWSQPGMQAVVRVTCVDDEQQHLATCQLWSTNPQGVWMQRDDIAVSGKETRLEVEFAVVAAGCSVDLTPEGAPRWRVDANGDSTTYLLDIRLTMGQR